MEQADSEEAMCMTNKFIMENKKDLDTQYGIGCYLHQNEKPTSKPNDIINCRWPAIVPPAGNGDGGDCKKIWVWDKVQNMWIEFKSPIGGELCIHLQDLKLNILDTQYGIGCYLHQNEKPTSKPNDKSNCLWTKTQPQTLPQAVQTPAQHVTGTVLGGAIGSQLAVQTP